MSLDFSVERMANYKVLTTLEYDCDSMGHVSRWHPITDALVWSTMYIGINHITEENWEEFYQRLHLWEKTFETRLSYNSQPAGHKRYITRLEVFMHIGLYTNATQLSESKFLKNMFENFKRENTEKPHATKDKYDALKIASITEAFWREKNLLDPAIRKEKLLFDTDSIVEYLQEQHLEEEKTEA